MKQTFFVAYICAIATIALTSCKSTQDELISKSPSQLTSKEILAANVPNKYMEMGHKTMEQLNELMLDLSQNVNANCDDAIYAFAKKRYQTLASRLKSPNKAPVIEETYEVSLEEMEIVGKINKMILTSNDMTLSANQTQEIMNDIHELPMIQQEALNVYMVIIDEIPTITQEGKWLFYDDEYLLCMVGAGIAGAFAGALVSEAGVFVSIVVATVVVECASNLMGCANHHGDEGVIYVSKDFEINQAVMPTIIAENEKIDLSDNKVWAEPTSTLAGRVIKDSDFINGSETEIAVFKKCLENGNDLNETKQKLLN